MQAFLDTIALGPQYEGQSRPASSKKDDPHAPHQNRPCIIAVIQTPRAPSPGASHPLHAWAPRFGNPLPHRLRTITVGVLSPPPARCSLLFQPKPLLSGKHTETHIDRHTIHTDTYIHRNTQTHIGTHTDIYTQRHTYKHRHKTHTDIHIQMYIDIHTQRHSQVTAMNPIFRKILPQALCWFFPICSLKSILCPFLPCSVPRSWPLGTPPTPRRLPCPPGRQLGAEWHGRLREEDRPAGGSPECGFHSGGTLYVYSEKCNKMTTPTLMKRVRIIWIELRTTQPALGSWCYIHDCIRDWITQLWGNVLTSGHGMSTLLRPWDLPFSPV